MPADAGNERKRSDPSGDSHTAQDESISKKPKIEENSEEPLRGEAGHKVPKTEFKKKDIYEKDIGREDKRGGGRGGRGGRGGGSWGRKQGETQEEAEDKTPRLPKRKVSVAFGYCGTGYSGLQINDGVKTIEGDIFAAFCKLGAISEDNAVGLQRAARTDRGVHAAGNLLVLKLILEPPAAGPSGLVAKMNETLPEFIRIWGFSKVENSFNARSSCDSRQYEYLLPTYVFLPPKPGSHMHSMMKKWKDDMKEEEEGEKLASGDDYRPTLAYLLDHPFWRAQDKDQNFHLDTAAKKQWRLSSKQLERIRDIFSKYEGSHNFHNYTLGKMFRERSAQRNMLKLTISEPKIINETEWLSIKFHGQSFMLHQIRKMIGMLILIGRSTAPASLIPETYGPARIHVPKAPGLGLLLEEPLFGGYNRHLEESLKRQPDLGKAGPGDGGVAKEEIIFSKYAEDKDAFKNHWIYDRIYREEEETHEYVKFLQYLDVLSGEDFEFLNPRGVIPTCSIIKLGEHVRKLPGKKVEEGDSDVKDVKTAEEEDGDIKGESDDEEELLKGKAEELEG